RDLAGSVDSLGVLLRRAGQRPEAQAACLAAAALREQLLAEGPDMVSHIVDLGTSYSHLSSFAMGDRDWTGALQWNDKALAAFRPALERNPRLNQVQLLVRNAHGNRAGALAELRRYPEAVKACDEALAANSQTDYASRMRWLRDMSQAMVWAQT